MNRNEILNEIKKKNTFEANDLIFDRILSGIEDYEQEIKPVFAHKRSRILRPAVIFYVIVIVIASTFAVTAAVNEDIRMYLISIFGGNPNAVNGELVGVTAESDGVELTVDAVVAEGDSLFMVYTLQDKAHRVFNESTSINSYKVSVGEDSNYNATYNSIIKNGEKNYMIIYGNGVKKGVQKMQFSLESLKTPDLAKEFIICAGTTDYKPEGIPGYTIDYVRLSNNRIEAAINISSQDQYIHNYNIRIQNTKTGKTFCQKGETTDTDSDGNTKMIRWYSEKLDEGKAEDYQFILSFDKVYTFEKPLQADFSVDFGRKPVKTIYPDNIRVLTAIVEKVIVHQMIIVADLRDAPKPENQNDKPIQSSEANDTFFLEEDKERGIIGQKMTVCYEDGTEAALINSSATSYDQVNYRFYLILNGPLDYSRKPALFIGDTKIPLY